MKKLVIVESPTKAKTISKFLGKDYTVLSSFGHVRDLPKSKIGVDVEHNFEPHYIVSRDKTKTVKELKAAAKKSDGVLFATDEDREGEAISWHLAHILDIPEGEAQRITFHEITKRAIEKALEHPRPLDMKLIDAQQARRVLDRLVGYNLSPFLWRKVARGLSAGRVQSVAVRLVVEREREIKDFKPEEYWTLEGLFDTPPSEGGRGMSETLLKPPFPPQGGRIKAWLHSIKEKKLDKLDLKNKEQVDGIIKDLHGTTYAITNVEKKKTKRTPAAPYTTSTLQQDANNSLGFSAKLTMRLAQQLYEGVELGSEGHVGLITYMRTDAVNLSDLFVSEAAQVVESEFGKKYTLDAPRKYANKNKNAQEAHEAIRPTEAHRTPDSLKVFLTPQQYRLYDLIWRRAVATQMADAELNATSIDITSANTYMFHATGQMIVFDGWLKLYPDKTKENALPEVTVGDAATCQELTPEQHFTEPPARYSDAALVKALEEYGIGRPSTYAPTIATIESRGYVQRDDKKKLVPADMAYLVNDLLVEHFPHIVDFQFTASMEEDLDKIAEGEKKWQPIIAAFYKPFKENLDIKDKELSKKELTEEATSEVCDKCAKPMIIKFGRFGKFMACSGYPECKNTKPLPGDEVPVPPELSEQKCDKCGSPMAVKRGRFGPFLGCSKYPDCKNIKSIEIKVNVKCPKCTIGDLIQKKSKRGKMFFSCNRYPECEFALWDRPNGEKCPQCASLLTSTFKGVVKCSNKECSFKPPAAA